MATDIFAKIGDIKGESADAKHKDEIEVLSFSWGVANSGGLEFGTGGSAGGDLPGSDHRSQHRQGDAEASRSLRHRHTPEGRDDHASQGRQGFVKMNDVIITAVAHGGTTAQPASETVTLAFAKVDFEYKPQKPDGSLDAGIHFKYDLKANKVG
jgi:type VI secretion system secreted protein Hcp